MKYGFIIAGAAAILSGCCSCPQPCPELINKPDATCPKGGWFCSCTAAHVPQVNTYSTTGNEILDGFLEKWVRVRADRSKCVMTNDGHMKAQAALKNTKGDPVQISYKFDWYNGQGERVEDLFHATFTKHVLKPGDDGLISSIAPTQECVAWKLRIKYVP